MTDTLRAPRPDGRVAAPQQSAQRHPDHARRWWILAVIGVAQLMVVLDSTVVNIALPSAQADLGFSDASRQWVVTAYALAFGSLLLIGGRIADVFGRKRVFLIGLGGFALASAIGGAAIDFPMLVAARAVQGGFGALLAPAGLSLLTTTFTEAKERGKAFGIYGGIAGAGASIGLLLGGFLTEYASWRWTMFVNLVFAAFALVGGMTFLTHRAAESRPHLDLTGTVLVSAGLFSLVYGFSNANTNGWSNPLTIGFLVAAAVLLVAFVIFETRVPNPLLPMRVVLDRNRGGAYLAMFFSAIGMFGVFLFLTYYLEVTLSYSSVKTGLVFLPMTGLLVVTAGTASTLLATRVSPRLLIPVGMVLAAIGMAMLTRIGLQSQYVSVILPGTLVIGLGLGLVFAPAFSIGTLGVRPEDSGVASATVNTVQQIGGSIGTALLNTIASTAAATYVAAHLRDGSAQLVGAKAALHSYTTAFWWSAAIFAIAGVLVAVTLRSGVPQLDDDAPVAMAH
jgi:EmrB/QacA subfamily drug resistance transporter